MDENERRETYESPMVKVEEIQVEQGFALSPPKGTGSDMPWGNMVFMIMLLLSSCGVEIIEPIPQDENISKITMSAADFVYLGSRTDFVIGEDGASFKWVANDTVGIFPNDGGQVYFPMIDGAGSNSATFTGGGWALKPSATYASYYPFVGNIYLDKTKIPISYLNQTQVSNGSTAHLGKYDFMAASATTSQNGSVDFKFNHLGCLVRFEITVPDAGTTLESLSLNVRTSYPFIGGGYMDLSKEIPDLISKGAMYGGSSLRLEEIVTTESNEIITAYMMIPPADLSELSIYTSLYVSTANSSTHENIDLPSTNFEAGKAYTFSIQLPSAYSRIVTVEEPGTLEYAIWGYSNTLEDLKVIGPLNGSDIRLLRKMAGVDVNLQETTGKLRRLDLSEVTIVEGGDYYSTQGNWGSSTAEDYQLYTKNNVFGALMFAYSKLQEIKLPLSIVEMEDKALAQCNSLTKLTIPESVESIESYSVWHCDSIKEVVLPSTLSTMGEGVFQACFALESIPEWPSNLKMIPSYTFAACYALTNVVIPDNVTKIGNHSFRDCTSLESVTIHANVDDLGSSQTFSGCSSLKRVINYSTEPQWIHGHNIFDSPTKAILYVPYESVNEYEESYSYSSGRGWYEVFGSSIYSIEYSLPYH